MKSVTTIAVIALALLLSPTSSRTLRKGRSSSNQPTTVPPTEEPGCFDKCKKEATYIGAGICELQQAAICGYHDISGYFDSSGSSDGSMTDTIQAPSTSDGCFAPCQHIKKEGRKIVCEAKQAVKCGYDKVYSYILGSGTSQDGTIINQDQTSAGEAKSNGNNSNSTSSSKNDDDETIQLPVLP